MADGPTATFVFSHAGQRPTPQAIRAVLPYAAQLAQGLPGLPSPDTDFACFVTEGTPGDLEAMAAALITLFQWLSGDPVGPARIAGVSNEGVQIACQYARQAVFHKCLELSLHQLILWLENKTESPEAEHFLHARDAFLQKARAQGRNLESCLLAIEARRRGVPVRLLGDSYLSLGWGHKQRRVGNVLTHTSSWAAAKLNANTQLSLWVLAHAGLPVTQGATAMLPSEAVQAAQHLGWPLVVKPLDAQCSAGVTLRVRDSEALHTAFTKAAACTKGPILLEKHLPGTAWKFLVVQDTCLAVTNCDPAASSPSLSVIHQDNLHLMIRAAKLAGLGLAEITFICPDLQRSWHEAGGAICRLRALPDLAAHRRAHPALDLSSALFTATHGDHNFRIPVAAITGSNGKTTTSRMLQVILRAAGFKTGLSCSMGLWVDDEVVNRSNLSGEPGGRMLLNLPEVEAAVMEMPRQGLLRFGHPCDSYDVAALLNVLDDHIGDLGINSREDMARLKATLLSRASKAIVVSAEDKLCLEASARGMPAPRILFSRDAQAPALQAHLREGGTAVYSDLQDGRSWLFHATASGVTPLMPLDEIPATMNGLLHHNEANALAACAIALGLGIPAEAICKGLRGFHNSTRCNPGRCNFIEGFPSKVLLDFANNAASISELKRIVKSLNIKGQTWIVSTQLGNQHRRSLEEAIPVLAGHFDHYIVGCEPDWVTDLEGFGKEDPKGTLLRVFREGLLAQGVPAEAIQVEAVPAKAIQLALASAGPEDLVILGAEAWSAIPLLERLRQERAQAALAPLS